MTSIGSASAPQAAEAKAAPPAIPKALSRTATVLSSSRMRLTVFLSRHGESEFNLTGRVGGDSDLSAMGHVYARKLPETMAKILPESVETLHIWTSTLRRTHSTAAHFPENYPRKSWSELDEIYAGDCDEYTYEEIEEKWPEVMEDRERDKFNFRYPNGESYSDITDRLLPLLHHLQDVLSSPSFLSSEDRSPREAVLIIGHQAVLRCVLAMLKKNVADDEVPYVKVPLHTLMRVEWGGDKPALEKRWRMDIPGADTHREAQAKRTNAPPEPEVPYSPIYLSSLKPDIELPLAPAKADSAQNTQPAAVEDSSTRNGGKAGPDESAATSAGPLPIVGHAAVGASVSHAAPTPINTKPPIFALALTPPPGPSALGGGDQADLVPTLIRVPSVVDVALVAENLDSKVDDNNNPSLQLPKGLPTGPFADRMNRGKSFSYGDSH
ncbi:histidine phosphatase superfamily [Hyaloraphidium curvatum]|nr:histidine phosphatase superfamily [Hyaloraphidium curvatum]